MADDDGFITLPPGMADSATHRRDRVERPRKVERDEIVFFPAAPGAPVVEPTPEQPTAPIEPPQLFQQAPPVEPVETTPEPATESDDVDATRVSISRHAAPAWRITVPGREPVTVEGPLFLGRNPAAPTSHPGARVLAVDDPAKSVSKTHAMLDIEQGALRVTDLGSTNGVWVVPPGAEAIEVVPGSAVAVPAGADIELGDLVIQVELG
jgi:hypothetical protein